MNIQESLGEAQEHARTMLVEQFDEQRGIPMRAPSHTDLWPGDRWPEAYLAAGLPDMAYAAMESIGRSQRPDGLFPHLMQGSHKRLGMETRWIDRQIYRLQSNGAEQLPNGEWVTTSIAPPTQAISALAVLNAGLTLPKNVTAESLEASMDALNERRTRPSMRTNLLYSQRIDELTSSKGDLADELKQKGAVIDPAINALYVENEDALAELSTLTGAHALSGNPAARALSYRLARQQESGVPPTREEVLAIARMGSTFRKISNNTLRELYAPVGTEETHPERTRLTMAECIEVARLTPYAEASQEYLARVLELITRVGKGAITRFEGAAPGKNAITNKYNRKHLWLPTAAEIVQIDPTLYK